MRELAQLLTVDASDVGFTSRYHYDLTNFCSTKQVVVFIDEQIKKGGSKAELAEKRQETYSILQKTGQNALVVVTSNLERARASLEKSSPEIKKSVSKNSRDVLVVVDKT